MTPLCTMTYLSLWSPSLIAYDQQLVVGNISSQTPGDWQANGKTGHIGGRDTWAGLRADRCGEKQLNLRVMYRPHHNSLFISSCFVHSVTLGFEVCKIIRYLKQISSRSTGILSSFTLCSTLKYMIYEYHTFFMTLK